MRVPAGVPFRWHLGTPGCRYGTVFRCFFLALSRGHIRHFLASASNLQRFLSTKTEISASPPPPPLSPNRIVVVRLGVFSVWLSR